MKRFFAILFAVLYTTLTSGVAINVHYCMGKVAGIDLREAPAGKCQLCGKPSKGMDCCKDEFKFCKVTESHQAAKALQQDFSIAMNIQLPVRILTVPALPVAKVLTGRDHPDPPEITDNHLFLQNCTFLI